MNSAGFGSIWTDGSFSTGFDGYRTLTTAPPEQLLFFVAGLVVVLVVLSVSHAVLHTIQPPPPSLDTQKKKATTTLTGRTATMTTESSTASPRDDGPHSVVSAPPTSQMYHHPQPSLSAVLSSSAQQRTNNNARSKSVLMWGDSVSHVMSDGGRHTTAIFSQQQQTEIMLDNDDDEEDPSVTQHHSNRSRRPPPRPTPTLLSTADTTSTMSWWQQPHKVHQGELLQQHSVVSAPQLPSDHVFRKQQQRAVLSEAAAGSMLQGETDGDENDEEDGVVVVDPDDFVIRSTSSLPMLRHRSNHQHHRAYPATTRQYYDMDDESDDDDDDIGTIILSSSSSVMPPLSPDAVVPEDAADADDTGQLVQYPSSAQRTATVGLFRETNDTTTTTTTLLFDTLWDIVQPTMEHRRLCYAMLPPMIEPVVRLVLAALIAWWLGTPALMAYVLVHWILGNVLTKDLVQAVTDVESNLVKDSILLVGGDDGLLFAGQSMQLALWLQGILSMGLLALVCYTGVLAVVVEWLFMGASSGTTEEVAATYTQAIEIAESYARIILWDVWIRNTSKTLFLPLHMMNQGQFEYIMDAGAAVASCVAVVVVGWGRSSSSDELVRFGWVQVAIGVLALCCKLAVVKACELSAPYEKGFLASVTLFVRATFVQWVRRISHCSFGVAEPQSCRCFSVPSITFICWLVVGTTRMGRVCCLGAVFRWSRRYDFAFRTPCVPFSPSTTFQLLLGR